MRRKSQRMLSTIGIKRALLDEPESKLFAPLYAVQAGYVNKETDEPYNVAMIEMATLIKFYRD